jgi:hypothetical protein
MKIEIEIKPKDQLRYDTVGDYFYKPDGTLRFEIADTGTEFYTKLILIHEIVEEALTKYKGITEQQITDFDLYYEKRRAQGLVPENSEPGFDNNAPYLFEHILASSVEMVMCSHAGLSWTDYDYAINNL